MAEKMWLVWQPGVNGPAPSLVFDEIPNSLRERALQIREISERDLQQKQIKGRETLLDALARTFPFQHAEAS